MDSGFFEKNAPEGSSILLSNWPCVKQEYVNEELEVFFSELMQIRELAFKEVEELRQKKEIGKSLEAEIIIEAPKDQLEKLKNIEQELKQVFIVSKISFKEGNALKLSAKAFQGEKCYRCWKLFDKHEIQNGICHTCAEAIS